MSLNHSRKTSDKTSQDCRGISSGVTILRPRSPTTKCSTEKGLIEFVERGIKDTFSDTSLHHLHYDQECTNFNHRSACAAGAGTSEFQNPLSSLKVADSSVGLITDVWSSNPVSSSENINKTTADRTFGFVADAQSLNPVSTSVNKNETPTLTARSRSSPKGETGLQITNVQSLAITSIEADLLTSDGTNENDKGKKGVNVESFETPTTQPQNAANKTIQLLDSLINPLKVATVKRKAEVQITGVAPPPPPPPPPALEVTIIYYVDSSAEENSDSEPETDAVGRPERLSLQHSWKKKKLDVLPATTKPSSTQPPPKKRRVVTAEKKSLALKSLPVRTPVYRCCYCRYRSLKKKKVEGHVREKHSPKPIKYFTQYVNCSRELVRAYPKPASSETRTAAINGEGGGGSAGGNKYSCMFCNYQLDDMQMMRQHMLKVHPSKNLCCVDNHLKASNEKNFYTFFCCLHKCDFQSVSPQKYIEHVNKCTPFHNTGSEYKPTGIQQSVIFAENLLDQMELYGDPLSSSKKKDEKEAKKDRKEEAPSCSYSAPTPFSATASKKDRDRDSSSSSRKELDGDTSSIGESRDYSCHRCTLTGVGHDAMKHHMLTFHPKRSMIAMVKTYDIWGPDFFIFCPDKTCKYVTQRKMDLEIHRNLKHGKLKYEV